MVRARLYAAASHHAAFSINGSPCLETTNFGYPGEHFYNAADVTDALQSGDTAALTAVAHWYGPGQGRAAGRPGLLAQLTVEYDDGTPGRVRFRTWVAGGRRSVPAERIPER